MSAQPSTPAQNPIALLQEQLLRLTDIYQAQQEQINLLRTQNEHLAQALQEIAAQPSPQGEVISARIEDLQVSFGSMVVFLFKLLPAAFLALLLWGIILSGVALLFGILAILAGLPYR